MATTAKKDNPHEAPGEKVKAALFTTGTVLMEKDTVGEKAVYSLPFLHVSDIAPFKATRVGNWAVTRDIAYELKSGK